MEQSSTKLGYTNKVDVELFMTSKGAMKVVREAMSASTQVTKSLTKESRESVHANGEDRISHLPEGLISNILSRLPTKEAVRTSVLSKEWEDNWTSIYSICIDDYHIRMAESASFINSIERILLISRNIKTFRVKSHVNARLGGHLTTWITTLLRGNVEILELLLRAERIVLPRCLVNNSSLRKLSLSNLSTFKVPSKNNYANLKCLYLSGVDIVNESSSTDTLIFTFPVLETFEWVDCRWMNVKIVEIFAPSLTSFVSETSSDYITILDYSIKFSAPKLVNFKCSGGSAENFVMAGAPVVVAVLHHDVSRVNLELLEYYGLQFRSLLKGLSSIEDLKLTVWVAKAIAYVEEGLAPPMCNTLRKLYLDLGCDIEALLVLLHVAPSLRVLIVDVFPYDDEVDRYDYDAVEHVPSCILSHLEEVELLKYSYPTGLATFLFKNGVNLKKFRVCVDKYVSKAKVMKEMLAFPKASTCVSIVVD